MSEVEVELVYFAGPGRAELTRLALHAGGVAFTDTKIQMGDWPALKGDASSLPAQLFGSMPVLKHGDFKLAQSAAVAQYAAELGLSAGADCKQRGMDMMMIGAHADLQSAMYGCLFGSEEAKKAGMEGLVGKVTPHLKGIENQYKEGPFLYSPEGEGPSLGDLAIFDAVTSPFPGLEALKVDLTPFPKIQAMVEAVKSSEARPGLKAYLTERGF